MSGLNSAEAAILCENGIECGQFFGPNSPEVGPDHADVWPAAAKNGLERTTKSAFHGAARSASNGFHMAAHHLLLVGARLTSERAAATVPSGRRWTEKSPLIMPPTMFESSDHTARPTAH